VVFSEFFGLSLSLFASRWLNPRDTLIIFYWLVQGHLTGSNVQIVVLLIFHAGLYRVWAGLQRYSQRLVVSLIPGRAIYYRPP
jgi:hypothetical protein